MNLASDVAELGQVHAHSADMGSEHRVLHYGQELPGAVER